MIWKAQSIYGILSFWLKNRKLNYLLIKSKSIVYQRQYPKGLAIVLALFFCILKEKLQNFSSNLNINYGFKKATF